MTNDDDEAVQLLGQPGWEQEVDSDFEREFAQLVGAPPAGKGSQQQALRGHVQMAGLAMHALRRE